MTYYMVLPESLKLRCFQFVVGKTYHQQGFIESPVKTPGFYLYKDAAVFKEIQQFSSNLGGLREPLVIVPVEIDSKRQPIHMSDGSLKVESVTIGTPINPADLLNIESQEFIEQAIKISAASVYPWLVKEKRTAEISWAAIKEDGRMLREVPEEIKTPELCVSAFINIKDKRNHESWKLIEYIPDSFKTSEFFIQLLSHSEFRCGRNFVILPSVFDHYTVNIIDLIPTHLKTRTFWQDAVNHNGTVFWILNEEQRSSEIYLEAYKQGVIRICCGDYIEAFYTNQPKLLCSLASSWLSWWW